jgi:ribonuclease HI
MTSVAQVREDAVNVFTDGSSLSAPRTGGIGIRIVTIDSEGKEVVEDDVLPGYRGATNNQMELLACIKGVQTAMVHPRLEVLKRICVFTDSQYVASNVDNAKFVWPTQQWRTKAGTPVLNAKLWKELTKEIRKAACRVDIRWVKGHSKKSPHNRAVDKLAKRSAAMAINLPLSVVNVRRKKTDRAVALGSVKMEGQRLAIRVVTSEYLSIQRISKYKYEVLSEDSKYLGNVDVIYSKLHLRVGRHYKVLVNKETSNPRILELLHEIERGAAAT